jgi:hypothetical protein
MIYKSWPDLTYEQTVFRKLTNSTITKERSWLHENISNKDVLLISVGDSWTWGDSLFDIDISTPNYDNPNRVTHIYGAKLAKLLNADFVNVGECGGNNYDMLQRLSKLLKYNDKKYKKIYVVVTLTENCRELTRAKKSIWATRSDSFHDFLFSYERKMFLSFKSVFEDYPDVKFLIGRNFTYSFNQNVEDMKKYHLGKTWVDIINDQVNAYYPKDIRFLSSMAIKPLESFMRQHGFFDAMIEDMMLEFEKASKAIEWLDASPYNHKKATRHPTVEGHELWANYLHEQLLK